MVLTYINLGFLFLLGAVIGSFLNVVSDRSIKNESIVSGHSKCDKCGKKLKPSQLIPLISFLIQKGRCANCKTRLSFYYPFSEILSGLLVILSGLLSKFSFFEKFDSWVLIGFLFLVVTFSFFEILLLTDLKYLLIPDKIVIPAVIFVAFFQIVSTAWSLLEYKKRLAADDFGKYLLKVGFFQDQVVAAAKSLGLTFLTALAIAAFFAFLVWITKGRGMGGGDIRLGFLIGLVNGFPYNLLAVFLGFLSGAVVSVALVLARKKTLKSVVPFGPFLILGSILSFVWGAQILDWYFNLL